MKVILLDSKNKIGEIDIQKDNLMVMLACGLFSYEDVNYKIINSHVNIPSYSPVRSCEPTVSLGVKIL